MKNRYFNICIVGIIILLSYPVSSCNNDGDAPAPLTDYVAEDEDFENFKEWTIVAQLKGRTAGRTGRCTVW